MAIHSTALLLLGSFAKVAKVVPSESVAQPANVRAVTPGMGIIAPAGPRLRTVLLLVAAARLPNPFSRGTAAVSTSLGVQPQQSQLHPSEPSSHKGHKVAPVIAAHMQRCPPLMQPHRTRGSRAGGVEERRRRKSQYAGPLPRAGGHAVSFVPRHAPGPCGTGLPAPPSDSTQ